MIIVRDLQKHYGAIKAVDGVSFDCPNGQITGLLGPNGAGKTTTLRMIAGLIKPQVGTVEIDNVDVTRHPQQARALLGVQSDMTGVYPRLTAREQIAYYGRFYGLKGRS
jgi:sodium transport system ATP-binding protein